MPRTTYPLRRWEGLKAKAMDRSDFITFELKSTIAEWQRTHVVVGSLLHLLRARLSNDKILFFEANHLKRLTLSEHRLVQKIEGTLHHNPLLFKKP